MYIKMYIQVLLNSVGNDIFVYQTRSILTDGLSEVMGAQNCIKKGSRNIIIVFTLRKLSQNEGQFSSTALGIDTFMSNITILENMYVVLYFAMTKFDPV